MSTHIGRSFLCCCLIFHNEHIRIRGVYRWENNIKEIKLQLNGVESSTIGRFITKAYTPRSPTSVLWFEKKKKEKKLSI